MEQSSTSTQDNIDKQVNRIKRKLFASWMSSNGAKLSEIGDRFGVSSGRAKQLIDYGNRRISILMSSKGSRIGSTSRATLTTGEAEFIRMCNFDISLMDSIKELSEIGIDLSELTIKPA